MLEHDEDFDRVSLITHKRLSFGRKRGVGLSFLHLERNKDKVSFSERIRKFIFLLGAKGSENDKGGIFRVAPFVNPKTPHKRKAGEKRTFAPLSKGAKGKRQQEDKSDMENTSKKEVETINKGV